MWFLGSCFCSLEFAFLNILSLGLVLLLRLDISLLLSSYYWWLGLILFWFFGSLNLFFLRSFLFYLGLRRNFDLLILTLGDLRFNLWRLLLFVFRFLNFWDVCFCTRFLVYFVIGFFVSLSCWSCFLNYLCDFLFSFGWALLTCDCLHLLLLLLGLFLGVFLVFLFTLYLL